MSKSKKINESEFANAFKSLEQIVKEFEQGGLDLEQGLAKFQKALKLAHVCKKRLDEVENKVVKIKKQFKEFSNLS